MSAVFFVKGIRKRKQETLYSSNGYLVFTGIDDIFSGIDVPVPMSRRRAVATGLKKTANQRLTVFIWQEISAQ